MAIWAAFLQLLGDFATSVVVRAGLNRAVVGGPAGPAMATPLFLPRKFILVFFAF